MMSGAYVSTPAAVAAAAGGGDSAAVMDFTDDDSVNTFQVPGNRYIIN
jgi:hypothetical protein